MADSDLEFALRIRAAFEGQEAVVKLASSFIDVNKQLEQLQRGLTAVFGSSEAGVKEFDYLAETAKKYGLNILDLSTNYLRLSAAAKDTNLEGEATKKIFEAVTSSMVVLGSSTDQVNHAFLAIEQMMSKTQVTAEELRRQLANSIPGAMELMARSIGLTVAEMTALMQAGLLTSDALLPFAFQLEKEFGHLAGQSVTFQQAVSGMITTWSLLMKQIGDTGIWKTLTSALSDLGSHVELIAGAIGAGLGAAVYKIGTAFSALVVSVKASVAEISAQTGFVNKALGLLAGPGGMIASVIAGFVAMAVIFGKQSEETKNLEKSTTDYTEALQRMTAAQIASQNVAAQKEIDSIKKKIDSYNEQLILIDKLGIAQSDYGDSLVGIASAEDMAKSKEEERNKIVTALQEATDKLTVLEGKRVLGTEQLSNKLNELNTNLVDNVKKNNDLSDSIEKQKGKIKELNEINDGSNAIIKQKAIATEQLHEIEKKKLISDTQVKTAQDELKTSMAALAEQTGLSAKGVEALLSNDAQLETGLTSQEKAILNNVRSLSQLSLKMKELAGDVKTSKAELDAYTKTQNAQNEAILRQVNAEGNLARVREANIQKAKNAQTSLEAEIELNKKSVAAIQAEIDAKQVSLNVDKKHTAQITAAIETLKAKLIAEQADLAQKKLLIDAIEAEKQATLDSNSAIADSIERINKAREDSDRKVIAASAAASGEIIGNFIQQQKAYEESNAKLKETQKIYDELRVDAPFTIGELITAEENLTKAEANAEEQAKSFAEAKAAADQEMVISTIKANLEIKANAEKQQRDLETLYATSWKKIGMDAEQSIKGMSFDTKQAIDSFVLLGTEGRLAGGEITKAFDRVLSRANTEKELTTLQEGLVNLASQGKITGFQFSESFLEVSKKLVDVKAAVDPVGKAFDKLGIGLPERLKAIADEHENAYRAINAVGSATKEADKAFLKYAESALIAANSGANVNTKQIQAEASARGLGNAYEELRRKVADVNPEFDAIIAKYGRINELQQIHNELSRQQITSYQELNAASQLRDENLGKESDLINDLVQSDQLRINQASQDLNIKQQQLETDRAEVKELENLVNAGQRLSPQQEDRLRILKETIPVEEQGIVQGQAKVAQIQSQVLSYQNFANELSRVNSIREQESALDKNILEGKKSVLDAETQLAKAKGDSAEVDRLNKESQQVQLDLLKETADEKQKLADNTVELTNKLRDQAEADGVVTDEEQAQIDKAQKVVEANQLQADAASKLVDVNKERAKSSKDAADAEKQHAAETKAMADGVNGILSGWHERLAGLNPELAKVFDYWVAGATDATKGMSKLDVEIYNHEELVKSLASLGPSTGMVSYLNNIAKKASELEGAYLSQAVAAENFVKQLNNVGQGGNFAARNLDLLIAQADAARNNMNMLDQQHLDALRSAIDSARQKMEDFRKASEDALLTAQQALLQEKGDQAGLTAMDHQKKQLELQSQLNEAKRMGDTQSIANLQEALSLEQQTYDLKLKKLEADKQQAILSANTNATSNSSSAKSINDLKSITDEATKAKEAISSLSGVDLSGLHSQLVGIHGSLSATNGLL